MHIWIKEKIKINIIDVCKKKKAYVYILSIYLVFVVLGNESQGLSHAKQALYPWSVLSAPTYRLNKIYDSYKDLLIYRNHS
jgi:hypothetical protein